MYDKRPDMPDRFINSPPQAAPRSGWPRKLADLSKQPLATEHFQLMCAQQIDQTVLYGPSGIASSASTAGGGSVATTDRAWYSQIGRFCQLIEISRSGVSAGFNSRRQRFDFSPFALMAPDSPRCPFVFRFEDTMAMTLLTVGDGSLALHFGIGQNTVGATLGPTELFVGFYAAIEGTGSDLGPYGTWRARAYDPGGIDFNESTGITTQLPHHLAVEMDGGTGEIRYYIDNELVATATEYFGTTVISTELFVNWTVVRGGGPNAANGRAGYWIDNQACVSVRVQDEAA